jgi:hypothetical protein
MIRERALLLTVAILGLALASSLRGHDASAQDAPRRVPSSGSRIRAALARYATEPSVDELVRAALEAPALDPARAREAADRARLSGLLPQTRADVRRGQTLDLGALQGGTTDRTTWSSDDELAFGGSITFQLDRLLFASEEASLMRERRHLEERRLELVTQLVHLYFERRRLQLERDLAGETDVATEIRIVEVEALIDVLSAGAFSRMMVERARRSDSTAPPSATSDHHDDGADEAPAEPD